MAWLFVSHQPFEAEPSCVSGFLKSSTLPECVWKRRVVEEMDETHLIVVIGWPALKSVERA